MTEQTRSFTSRADEIEPVVVEVNGERFTARPYIPGSVLLNLARARSEVKQAAAIGDALRACFDEDEWDRFDAFCSDPAQRIDAELLSQILDWLVTTAAARPTPPSSASADGRQSTGSTSTADASSLESIPAT